jgi:phosphoglycolate phosphatase
MMRRTKARNLAIFDLDGTISDPAEGITRSINHALVGLGFAAHPKKELLRYIGPHLHVTFSELAGITDQPTLSRAIALYRERYIPIGYRENVLYDGMADALSRLVSNGSILCIATSKRRDIACKVLEFLKIEKFFAQVHGCGLHRSKADLLRDIRSDAHLGQNPMVMIGDRETDFLAAAEVKMPSIAVRWGYGDEKEFAAATDVVATPAELQDAIIRNTQRG